MSPIRNYSAKKGKKSLLPEAHTVFESLRNEHLEALLVEGLSERTVITKRDHIRYFLKWLKERGIEEPVEVTRHVLEGYQRYLYHYRKTNGDPLSFSSQTQRLIALKMWFKWMTRQNHILHNPASEIDLPRTGHRLPRNVLTEREAELVLQQPDISVPLGLRDRALMEVLYATGMRRMEVGNLKLFDVDFDGRTVRIREGKGRKDRVVPIGSRAIAWMLKYINEARPLLVSEPDDYTIFLTNAGEPMDLGNITVFVHNYVEAAQIGKTGSAHMFRHTMATLMLNAGASPRHVQQILGHASLETTGKYLQIAILELQKVYEATHPGANLEAKKLPPSEAQRKTSRAELIAVLEAEIGAESSAELEEELAAEAAEEEELE